jgi:glycosyltransferase involved in cell wall biosynthesis
MTDKRPLIVCPNPIDSTGGLDAVVSTWQVEFTKRAVSPDYLYTTRATMKRGRRAFEAKQFLRFSKRLLTGQQPSLVHVHVGSGGSFLRKSVYIELAIKRGIPTVIHIHGLTQLINYYGNKPIQRRRFLKLLKQASLILSVSGRNAPIIEAWAPGQFSIETLYNPPKRDNIPLVQCPKPGVTTITFLGQFVRRKGIWELLDSATELRKAFPSCRLIMAGDGPELADFRAEVAKRNLEGFISLPGWVVGHERLNILKETDIFCLPSHSEGFPMSIVEAMIMGIGIVATDVGGIPEAVTDQKHALLTPVGDSAQLTKALLHLLSDSEYRAQLGRSAKERAESEISPDAIMTQLEDYWAGLLES